MTLTAQHRGALFGEVVGDEVLLTEFGLIVREEWLRTASLRSEVEFDDFIVMPDHFHGILLIEEERNGGKESMSSPVGANSNSPRRSTPFRSPSRTIGAIVRGIKGASAKRINKLRKTPGARIWQRNYCEHIVRDGNDLDRIRKYIADNVGQWTMDHAKRVAAAGTIGPATIELKVSKR